MDIQTAEKPKAKPVLHPTAMRSTGADYVRSTHHLVVGPEISVDDLMRPGFWAHHTAGLRIHDVIDVVSQDDSMDVTLRVVEKGTGFVRMRPLRVWVREGIAADEPDSGLPIPAGYKISFAPRTRWRVFTENPNMEISRDHPSREAAIIAATEHAAKAA